MKIFEYAAILHPTRARKEEGEQSVILVKPTVCLAHDLSAATVIASRALPEEVLDKLDRVEVAVRPFDRGCCATGRGSLGSPSSLSSASYFSASNV